MKEGIDVINLPHAEIKDVWIPGQEIARVPRELPFSVPPQKEKIMRGNVLKGKAIFGSEKKGEGGSSVLASLRILKPQGVEERWG